MWIIIDESLLMIWKFLFPTFRDDDQPVNLGTMLGGTKPYTYLTGDGLFHP